jgi:predicted glycogen debranching enzyme
VLELAANARRKLGQGAASSDVARRRTRAEFTQPTELEAELRTRARFRSAVRARYALPTVTQRTPTRSPAAPLFRLDRERLLELDFALSKEWLETDGLGGYASSTVLSCPTRRYHGWLVAPIPNSDKRHLFLARFEESVHSVGQAPIGGAGEKHFWLSMARYPGKWHPDGHRALESFELNPYPTWTYRVGGARLVKSLLMVRGSPSVLLRYEWLDADAAVDLKLRPLCGFREADALTFENVDLAPEVQYLDATKRGLRIKPYEGLPWMTLALAGEGAFDADPVWYRNVEYKLDLERGYDGHEDHFSPGLYRVRLAPGAAAYVCASLREAPVDVEQLWNAQVKLRCERAKAVRASWPVALDLGAEDFLYRARDGRLGVVAGYPWFTEWGRDTYISLPGLLLARGRVEECGEALEGATRHLQHGLMPNIFGRSPATSHYGSVDASLWFARAVRLYELAGGDSERIARRLRPALAEIAENYARGTALGIACDSDMLIHAGDVRTNATWMDAVAPEGPVTPRHGFAVEINALWYALLAHLEELAARAGESADAARWRSAKERAGTGFLARFWLPERRRLADVWLDGQADASVRPNMVIAAALEYSPLSVLQRADIVRVAENDLLTPRGLRTLSPRDAQYIGRYAGAPAERDRAYHQGTVWPWLMGFYVEAYLRAHSANHATRSHLRRLLDGFAPELAGHGLGHVSEVFDGDPPHRPGGCFAQAWSTAELLRAYQLCEPARGA